MSKRKPNLSEYCVADAIDNGLAEIAELRDELESWYDNLPESFQNGSKGEELETAKEALDQCTDSYISVPNCVASALPDDGGTEEKGFVGGLRFQVGLSTKRRKSRADRRDDAVAKLQGALDLIRETIDEGNLERGAEDPYAETRDEIESFCDDLENAIGEAEGAEFPRMYG